MTTFKAIKPEIRSQRNAFGTCLWVSFIIKCRIVLDSHHFGR
jgi:hypothetical protein